MTPSPPEECPKAAAALVLGLCPPARLAGLHNGACVWELPGGEEGPFVHAALRCAGFHATLSAGSSVSRLFVYNPALAENDAACAQARKCCDALRQCQQSAVQQLLPAIGGGAVAPAMSIQLGPRDVSILLRLYRDTPFETFAVQTTTPSAATPQENSGKADSRGNTRSPASQAVEKQEKPLEKWITDKFAIIASSSGTQLKIVTVLIVLFMVFTTIKGYLCPDFATANLQEKHWFCQGK